MTLTNKLRLLLAATTLLGAALPASANLITNGDFETGSLSGWTTFTYSTVAGAAPTIGTQWGYGTVTSYNTTGSGASNAAVFDVGQTALNCCLTAGGGVQQNFTVGTAGIYSFYMDIASANDASGQINGDPGTFSILVDGTTVASKAPVGFVSAFQVLRASVQGSLALGTGTHLLQIEVTRDGYAANTSTPTEYMDNVSVTPTGTPEPGSLLLLLGGFGSIVVQRLRGRP